MIFVSFIFGRNSKKFFPVRFSSAFIARGENCRFVVRTDTFIVPITISGFNKRAFAKDVCFVFHGFIVSICSALVFFLIFSLTTIVFSIHPNIQRGFMQHPPVFGQVLRKFVFILKCYGVINLNPYTKFKDKNFN